MRILVLTADYPKFLHDHYLTCPGLAEASYYEQLAARNASLFGVADFYSLNFTAHGHEARELHINNPWLQYAWAREHGLNLPALVPPPEREGKPARQARTVRIKQMLRPAKPLLNPIVWRAGNAARKVRAAIFPKPLPPNRREWEHRILRAQIEHYRPDMILNQELAYLRSPFFRAAKPPGSLLIGQIASSLPEDDPFDGYDLMISSLPNQVEWFRRRGLRAELNRLAFETSVLDRLGPPPPRDIALSFVGSLSPDHKSRIAFLEQLATRTALKVWGNGIERLPSTSPLHRCYQGEAWGRDMYQVLRRSKITLNFHIDLAEGWANNMRLFEAAGVGALLLTDWKKNLHDMFVPGEHVVAYRDAEDCIAQIDRLLADDCLREKIATAGQGHAVATQNYYLRTGEIAALASELAAGR